MSRRLRHSPTESLVPTGLGWLASAGQELRCRSGGRRRCGREGVGGQWGGTGRSGPGLEDTIVQRAVVEVLNAI